jgi:hypothetical protein
MNVAKAPTLAITASLLTSPAFAQAPAPDSAKPVEIDARAIGGIVTSRVGRPRVARTFPFVRRGVERRLQSGQAGTDAPILSRAEGAIKAPFATAS